MLIVRESFETELPRASEYQMIEIEEVNRDLSLPDTGLGIVTMQPYVRLSMDEPYRWPSEEKKSQIEKLKTTLNIAKRKDHCEKTHFTIFPEFSIPGLAGVATIQEALEDDSWEAGTVVIGGVDGLTKSDYTALCRNERSFVSQSNNVDKVEGKWVNCIITWLKTANNEGEKLVERWVQPKLYPSWPEGKTSPLSMFEGKSIYVFNLKPQNGPVFRFFSVVCIDWIAPFGSETGARAIVGALNHLWGKATDPTQVHMVFVPQCNKSRDDHHFLKNAYEYFHSKFPFVGRDKSVILFINTSGIIGPGPHDEYGHSSLIFSSSSPYEAEGCPPSYALCTRLLRGTDILKPCKDALFRESGEVVHSFRLFHPLYVNGIPRRVHPISPALVYSLDDKTNDPRVPGAQVPALVKWVNDRVDEIADFDDSLGNLQEPMNREKGRITKELRWCGEKDLNRMMTYGVVVTSGETEHNVDLWSDKEKKGLENIVDSLVYISCVEKVNVTGAKTHGWLVCDTTVIDILVVSGGSHLENMRYLSDYLPARRERVTLVISRDLKDGPMTNKDKSFLDPSPEFKWCSFNDLRNCLSSSSFDVFRDNLRAVSGI